MRHRWLRPRWPLETETRLRWWQLLSRQDQDDTLECLETETTTLTACVHILLLHLYDYFYTTCKSFWVIYRIICKFYVNCCVFCRWYWLVSIEADRYSDGCCWKCCEWRRLQQGWQHSTSLYLICFLCFLLPLRTVFCTSNVKAQLNF